MSDKNITVGIVSTFSPSRCGLATYIERIIPSFKNKVIVKKIPIKFSLSKINFSVPVMVDNNIDLVHINYIRSLFGINIIFLMLFLKLKRKPILVTLHSFSDHKISHRILNSIVFALANKIVVHSEIIARKKSFVYIPLGGSENKFYVPEKKNTKPVFLCSGFVRNNKRLDQVIDTFRKEQDCILHIAGTVQDKVYTDFYEKCKSKVRGVKNIIWTDKYLTEEEQLKIYAEADVLVIFYEQDFEIFQSAIVADALASGLPVVSTPHYGVKEQIPQGCGYILSGFSTEDFKKGIEMAKSNHTKWKKNLSKIKEKYLWKNIAHSYLDLYKTMAG